jgi:hypothetical protein
VCWKDPYDLNSNLTCYYFTKTSNNILSGILCIVDIHSFIKHKTNTHHAPGTFLRIRNKEMKNFGESEVLVDRRGKKAI